MVALVRLDQHRDAARVVDGARHRRQGVGIGENLVPGTQTRHAHRDMDGIATGRTGDTVVRALIRGELALERRASDSSPGSTLYRCRRPERMTSTARSIPASGMGSCCVNDFEKRFTQNPSVVVLLVVHLVLPALVTGVLPQTPVAGARVPLPPPAGVPKTEQYTGPLAEVRWCLKNCGGIGSSYQSRLAGHTRRQSTTSRRACARRRLETRTVG